VVRGAKVRELFAGDDEIGYGENDSSVAREWEMGRRKGREVDEVPLCANCVVEVDLDGLDKGMVVQRAVRRTKRDIGEMGRSRWERVDVSVFGACVESELTLSRGSEKVGRGTDRIPSRPYTKKRPWKWRTSVTRHRVTTVLFTSRCSIR
jgi:hypothetical protein